MDEAELLKRLLETFKIEAEEHIGIIVKGLIELEKETGSEKNKELLEKIYRSAHSMKGASRAVNLTDVEKICQSLEHCFSMIKNGELHLDPQTFDIFHSVVNTIEMLLDDNEEKPSKEIITKYIDLLDNIQDYQIASKTADLPVEKPEEEISHPTKTTKKETKPAKQAEKPASNKKEVKKEEVTSRDESETKDDHEAPVKKEPAASRPTQDTIRLSSRKLDEIYLVAEESLQIKLSHNQEIREIRELTEQVLQLKRKWTDLFSNYIRQEARGRDTDKMPRAGIHSVEQDYAKSYESLNEHIKSIDKQIQKLNQSARFTQSNTHNILEKLTGEIKQILMLPFSNLFDAFPKIVRELSKSMNKEVEIEIKGSGIEVDRRIMEALKDPLIHIIRNCVDHGIEKPAQRLEVNKSTRGKIEVDIQQLDANHVKIDIKDDGKGVDLKKVADKAVADGIISRADVEKLNKEEVMKLIFKSGISTSSIITDISGRGLGLAIVEENVENLGGKVSLHSEAGKGSVFSIRIPTSVSKSQGLLVRLNQRLFIIPVSGIIETLRVRPEKLKRIENKDTIQFQGRTLPLVPLASVLEMDREDIPKRQFLHIVVIESLNQRIGFVVDEIEDEQEVLFKKLGYPLRKVRNIAGACLLGSGELSPILNSQDLIKSAMQISGSQGSVKKTKTKDKKKSIILAEDSITSRLFLKNILEGAGFNVKATVDGREALTTLKQEKFDLLVSDIEMPRMNGFELTESIRKDKELSDLPIVLVTSLNKREDQERGIDVGANAYIIKSSFEQSNLLEVINRLI